MTSIDAALAGDNSAVLMDCDPGWDDALALVLLLANPSARRNNGPDVIGVTTVFGNGTLQQSTDNARRLTAFSAKPSVGVYAGCAHSMPRQGGEERLSPALRSAILEQLPGMGELGPEHAVDFIISAAKRHGRALTILATGPLTNIATAIVRSPDDMKRIGRLVVVGGALQSGNVTPGAEFNFFIDPEAANITIGAELNTVIIPLETCEQMASGTVLERLRQISTRPAKFTADIVEEQLLADNKGAALGFYDAVGALFVLDSTLFTLTRRRVGIETSGAAAGAILLSPEGPGWSVLIAESIDVQRAYGQLFQSLSE